MRINRRRTLCAAAVATALAGGLLLATANAAAGDATGASSSAANLSVAPVDWAANEAIVNLAQKIETMAGQNFTASNVDTVADKVDVYLANAPQALSDQLTSAFPGQVRLHTAIRSAAQQQALQLQVGDSVPALRARGVDVRTITPDPDGHLTVGVASDVDAAATLLTAQFSDPSLRVVADSRNIQLTTLRASDLSPWNGGDFIYHPGWVPSYCSAGPTVHNITTGTTYMITAAHCFLENGGGVGTSVSNGYVGNSGIVHGSGSAIGNVLEITANTGNTIDSAVINARSSVVDFNCAWNCSGRNTQGGTLANVVGSQICSDGAFEGETCGIKIRQLSLTTCPAGLSYCVYPVDYAYRDDLAIVNGNGDSGGPIYSYSGSTGKLLVQGVIDASGSATLTCSTSTQLATERHCFADIYYVPFGNIRNTWNLEANTG
jgi:hypothetical protein